MRYYEPKTANVLGFFLPSKISFDLKILKYLFFLIFYFHLSIVFGQSNIKLYGEVRDQKNGLPLANVLIQIKGYSYSGYCNSSGLFEIENLPAGNYDISFTLVGYQTKHIHNVTVLEDVPQKILVHLQRKILSSETILIEADRIEKMTDISGDKIIIDVREEKKRGLNNLTQILQQVAGLQVDSPGGSESKAVIRIHGSDANQVLVLLEGNRLNNPQTGEVDLSEVPFNEVDKIEVIRHGNTAMYGGGAFAGIVKIQTAEQVESSYLSANSKIASFSTYSGQLAAGLAFENGFARMTYLQDYSDQNFSYEYKDQNINRQNAWYRNRNFFSRVNYNFSIHKLTMGYSQRNGDRGLPSSFFNEQNVFGAKMFEKSQRVNLNYKWLPGGKFYLESAASYNKLEQQFKNEKDPSPFTRYSNKFINSTIETKLFSNAKLFRNLTSMIGLHYLKETLNQKDFLFSSNSVSEKNRETRSIYGGFEYEMSPDKFFVKSLKLFSALRYQKYFSKDAEFYPSLGFSFTPTIFSSINISGNWAKSVRYPDFNSLFWKSGIQSQGNPQLLPEKKTGWQSSLTFDFKKFYSPLIYVSYFSESLRDLIFWEQVRNNHWQPRNLDKAEKSGWDIQLKQNLFGEFISIRSSYSQIEAINKSGESTTHNKQLIFTPKNTVNSSLVGRYKNMNIFISFRYVSERQIVKANTGKPLPEYTVWDATVSYSIEYNKFSSKINLSIENLNGEQYQLIRGYPVPKKIFSMVINSIYKFD